MLLIRNAHFILSRFTCGFHSYLCSRSGQPGGIVISGLKESFKLKFPDLVVVKKKKSTEMKIVGKLQ